MPGAAVAFDTQGVVTVLARGIPTENDPAVDVFTGSFDDRTVAALKDWLHGDRSSIWRHRSDHLILQSGEDVGGQPTLRIVLRRTRPPGGHFPIYLDAAASARLTEAVTELAKGDWDRVATPNRPGHPLPRS